MADYRTIIGFGEPCPRFFNALGEPSLIWSLINQVETGDNVRFGRAGLGALLEFAA